MFSLKTENHEAFATVPNAFAPHEIDLIRSRIDKTERVAGMVGAGSEVTDKQIRDSLISWVHPDPGTQWIFERVASIVNTVNSQYFGLDLTQTESVQLTEYDSEYQGFYGAHTDLSYGSSGLSRYRKLSVTMQLSDPDEYEGGDLLLYHVNLKNPFMASRTKGTMTLFRSHIIHEVVPVTRGTRYSFVTWIQGPLLR